jgi:hypothetical protein
MSTSRLVRSTHPAAGARRVLPLVALALSCALSACSDDGQPANQDLGRLVIDQLPRSDYVVNRQVSGELGAEAASTATPMDPAKLARALVDAHFESGYSRVWESGKSYVTVLVFAFPGAHQAAQVVDAENAYLQTGLGIVISGDRAIPGAWTYILYGDTRVNSRGVFCQGEWFGADRYAVTVTTCSDHPGDVEQVRDLSSLEYARLLRATGASPAPLPSPSPT